MSCVVEIKSRRWGVDFTSFGRVLTKPNQNTVAAVSCLLYFILLLLSSHGCRQQHGDARRDRRVERCCDKVEYRQKREAGLKFHFESPGGEQTCV